MEGKNMEKKGFTLVELLVVIAIIAMLLAILMPALAKVRTLAQRIMCGTNIGGIGKAMLTYASDDKYESYPIAGPGGTNTTTWKVISTIEADCSWEWDRKDNPGSALNQSSGPYYSTISACLYLLVKYADVPPEQFICPGGDEKKFEMSLYDIGGSPPAYGTSFTDFWDFGDKDKTKNTALVGNWRDSRGHNSYCYQFPLPTAISGPAGTRGYPINASANSALVVMADRSPWFDKTNESNMRGSGSETPVTLWGNLCDNTTGEIKTEHVTKLNSFSHQREGQNVLYVDQHIKFEKTSTSGVDKDNIYTHWNVAGASLSTTVATRATTLQRGGTNYPEVVQTNSAIAKNCTQDVLDTYLVQDYN